MSLLSEAMENCVILNKITETDEYGGFISRYVEGAEFQSAITFDTSIEARQASKNGVTSLYTVTTEKNITLEYHMIFKRLRDSKIFRVTSDGNDVYTPRSAGLNMRQVTAEEWSLDSENKGGNANG